MRVNYIECHAGILPYYIAYTQYPADVGNNYKLRFGSVKF